MQMCRRCQVWKNVKPFLFEKFIGLKNVSSLILTETELILIIKKLIILKHNKTSGYDR
jgi:hypothetical protein